MRLLIVSFSSITTAQSNPKRHLAGVKLMDQAKTLDLCPEARCIKRKVFGRNC